MYQCIHRQIAIRIKCTRNGSLENVNHRTFRSIGPCAAVQWHRRYSFTLEWDYDLSGWTHTIHAQWATMHFFRLNIKSPLWTFAAAVLVLIHEGYLKTQFKLKKNISLHLLCLMPFKHIKLSVIFETKVKLLSYISY